MPKRKTKQTPIAYQAMASLPEDVVEILGTVVGIPVGTGVPIEKLLEAIIHLARSYDTIVDERGEEGHPVILPLPLSDDETAVESTPSVRDIEEAIVKMSESHIDSVSVHDRDDSAPRSLDGLITAAYILASGVPVIEDLLSNEEYNGEKEKIRMQAIREILSTTPEDIWGGASIVSIVNNRYRDIIAGRKGLGRKL